MAFDIKAAELINPRYKIGTKFVYGLSGSVSTEIRAKRPGWELFRDGAPEGEALGQVMARADNVWRRVRDVKGNVLPFSSGHFIRVLAARWI